MCSLYLGENLISGSKPINLGVRNIGEIVYSSLPLTDAGHHLLDGSLILGGGIYQGFVDYIADLYTENSSANYFTTEALWQQTVTDYGVCGKFVYDSTNNTVRLPKITGIIEGTTDASALGDLVKAGLPVHTHTRGTMNITGYITSNNWAGTATANSALYPAGNGPNSPTSGSGQNAIGFDASRSWTGSTSNPNYTDSIQNSSTVQPQTIKCFVYIVIANSAKTEIQVDIDQIAADLSGKADTDLSNIVPSESACSVIVNAMSTTTKNIIVSWGMPDYSAGITTGYNKSFVAPCDGIGIWSVSGNYATIVIHLGASTSSPTLARSAPDVGSANCTPFVSIPLNKGETYYIAFYNTIKSVFANTFYPLKGVH